jgi:hypothetical protein
MKENNRGEQRDKTRGWVLPVGLFFFFKLFLRCLYTFSSSSWLSAVAAVAIVQSGLHPTSLAVHMEGPRTALSLSLSLSQRNAAAVQHEHALSPLLSLSCLSASVSGPSLVPPTHSSFVQQPPICLFLLLSAVRRSLAPGRHFPCCSSCSCCCSCSLNPRRHLSFVFREGEGRDRSGPSPSFFLPSSRQGRRLYPIGHSPRHPSPVHPRVSGANQCPPPSHFTCLFWAGIIVRESSPARLASRSLPLSESKIDIHAAAGGGGRFSRGKRGEGRGWDTQNF